MEHNEVTNMCKDDMKKENEDIYIIEHQDSLKNKGENE